MKKLLNLSVLIFIVYGSFKAMAQENSPFLEEESDLESPFEFGGFGELHYTYNLPTKIANATTVIGLFEMDYHFNDRIGLHSEVSFEGDHFSNFDEFEAQQLGELDWENEFEVELEEMYLLFKLNSRMRLKTGLFIMRSGLVAERHNPTTYRSVRMPEAETRIIPGHWKEIGVELHGKWKGFEELHYSFGVVTGLNAAQFKGGSGIREGRSGGVNASASNIGLTGSLHLYAGHSRFQTSLYYGGTFGVSNQRAKELGLKNGLFGTPVFLPEVNYKYEHKGWDVRGVMALMYLHDAQKINWAFDRNVAKMAIGGYGEVAYNLLRLNNPETPRILYAFGRFEYLNMDYRLPQNGVKNEANLQRYFVIGANYLPIPNVAFKAEFNFRKNGPQNPDLIDRSLPYEPTYRTDSGYINVGMAYSF